MEYDRLVKIMTYKRCMKETIHDIVLIKVAERTVSLLMLSYALRYEETKT